LLIEPKSPQWNTQVGWTSLAAKSYMDMSF